MDHNFSTDHHLSASFDYAKWVNVTGTGGGSLVSMPTNPGPSNEEWSNNTPNFIVRVVDNYALSSSYQNYYGYQFQDALAWQKVFGFGSNR